MSLKFVCLLALVASTKAGILTTNQAYSDAPSVSYSSVSYPSETYAAPTYTAPAYKVAAPAYKVAAPAYKVAAPVYNVPASAYKVAAPAYKVSAPVYKVAAPAYNVPAPVYKVAAPAYNVPAPAYKVAAPVYKVAAPLAKTVVAEDYSTPAHYEFGYGVEDPHTGDVKSHQETREGDVVKGSYSLVEADGSRRIVDYTVDAHSGFNAVVRKEPASSHPVKAYAQPIVKSYSAPVVAQAAPAYYH